MKRYVMVAMGYIKAEEILPIEVIGNKFVIPVNEMLIDGEIQMVEVIKQY